MTNKTCQLCGGDMARIDRVNYRFKIREGWDCFITETHLFRCEECSEERVPDEVIWLSESVAEEINSRYPHRWTKKHTGMVDSACNHAIMFLKHEDPTQLI